MAWLSCQTKLSYKYRRRTHTVTPSLEESYLRVDISCASEACDVCRVGSSLSSALGTTISSSSSPVSASASASTGGAPVPSTLSATAPYYLIPDAAALSELIEVFELPDLSNYILLSSAVKQVAVHSGRKASRLRALYRDRRRRAVLFDDLHCADTAAAGELVPRALSAALFYAHHLGGRVPLVVLSDQLAAEAASAAAAAGAGETAAWQDTDHQDQGYGVGRSVGVGRGDEDQEDADEEAAVRRALLVDYLEAARAAGVQILSAAEYFAVHWPSGSAVSELYDSLVAAKAAAAESGEGSGGAGAGGGGGGEACYPAHLSQQEVEDGLTSGELLRGVVHVSRRSPHEAVVELGHGPDAALGRLVRVSGRRALNRAMEGDTVAVRLLPPGAASAAPPVASPARPGPGAAAEEEDDADKGAAAAPEGVDYGAELLADAESGAAGGEEGALAMADTQGTAALPAAEVVAILQRNVTDIVACLGQRDEAALRARLEVAGGTAGGGTAGGGGRRTELLVCMPLDRRLPALVVSTRQGAALVGCRFVVRVDSWERGSRYPRAHVVRVLGRLNDLRAESEAVLVQCGINHKPFCEAALAELPRVGPRGAADWAPPPAERAVRRDLTGPDYYVVSIDPVGCTDVDDAMHVRFLSGHEAEAAQQMYDRKQQQQQEGQGEGGRARRRAAAPAPAACEWVEVGVHIADVSWFVRAGGFLDGEARDRCTSVYLVDRRLDMLPALLSEQLCSLRQGVERFAVSVIWTLRRTPKEKEEGQQQQQGGGHHYEVVGKWFGRTIIRSRHQLHYQQAQDVLDCKHPAPGDELPPDHVPVLRKGLVVLDELAGQLHAARVAAGALELASAELRFRTEPDTGAPCGVVCKQKVPMMDVVAEMMIAANSAVAERIATAFPGAALLRNHPPPRQQAFEQVRALIEPHAGGPVDPSSNASLAAALERACAAAAAASDPAAAQLIKSLATRAMSEAQYNSSGTTPPATPMSYHYGLALQYYTHFTSPIRRYADVVVHRQLLAALAGAAVPPQPHADLAAAAHTMNVRHRQAKAAQKECSELFLLLLLHAKPHVERALVCGVGPGNRMEVFVPAYHLRGAVALTDRRGLPRPPLAAGGGGEGGAGHAAAAGAGAAGAGGHAAAAGGGGGAVVPAEDDPFEVARRRALRLVVREGEEVVIQDAASGTATWRAGLWQPVWVRLSAAGHRAHGPKLALALLHDTHPEAQAAAAALAASSGAGGQGRGKGREAAGPGPGAGVVGEGGRAGGQGPGGAGDAVVLPPVLRLVMQKREAAQAQVREAAAAAGGGTPTAAAAATEANASAGVQRGQGQDRDRVPSRPGDSPVPAAAAVTVGFSAAADGAVQLDEQQDAVLRAPCSAMAALCDEASLGILGEPAQGGGADAAGGGSGGEGGTLEEALRALQRRIARLEIKALSCRRGSEAERRIRERIGELRARAA